ncbi:MAG: DUF4190 domain-containing protein [Verrucomicrobia bacterium]|nr:DUF4190 domain-containing protein [Verrucomicrobiota bacterium]MCG2681752.1 DUF4190 domain-containing protein [Kiritimatiellia bacterium]MBU4247166.1 DUF4190 domain-containing protein [Verrucomicrobiota bacterium]MBU4291070.1 DUF4190 domain-containing protein [Verrucomicrobiota bacterium]MBU4429711.1 DUF4190 domain-containing protein [Verrucomicrobiota bacterium]
MTDQAKTSAGAIWSLVLGILGIFCLGPFGSIPAIIWGHISLSKINKSAGTIAGAGLAIAGFVLGYVGLALMIVVIPLMAAIAIPSFMRARTTAQANACINNLCQIEAAKDQYALDAGLTNGAAITFEKIGPTSSAGGYLKEWPRCPLSPSEEPASQARTEYDYNINPIGRNAACVHGETATPAHQR